MKQLSILILGLMVALGSNAQTTPWVATKDTQAVTMVLSDTTSRLWNSGGKQYRITATSSVVQSRGFAVTQRYNDSAQHVITGYYTNQAGQYVPFYKGTDYWLLVAYLDYTKRPIPAKYYVWELLFINKPAYLLEAKIYP